MKILEREFVGPLNLEYKNLPNSSGSYIVTHLHKGQIKPIYIGFTRDIKHRVHSLLVSGPIPKELLKDVELKLFYSIFETEEYSKGQEFEKELIETFEPTFNKNWHRPSKESLAAWRGENKVEKVRKFTSIVAGVASSAAIAATLSLSTGLLFDKNGDSINSSPLVNNQIITDYPNTVKKIKTSEREIELIKSELASLSTKPASKSWSIESNRLNQRILLIESKLSALEAALTIDPAKSLAIPILRKDLDNTQNAFKIELTQTKAEVDRVYDQNKWFIGMMVTVALAVLGMAINNFFSKKT